MAYVYRLRIRCPRCFIQKNSLCRRQHQNTTPNNSTTTWHGSNLGTPVSAKPEVLKSPERLKGTSSDLFELLEKAQRARIDDQRCMLPAYFNQVSLA